MKTINPTLNSLPLVMEYQHEEVVKRIAKVCNCKINEAKGIFQDTKRFLFLCGSYPGTFVPPANIDEGWHCFILFTRDYHNFCLNFFGDFIHHFPNIANENINATSQIHKTLEIAENAFGKLSDNWDFRKFASDGPVLEIGCSDTPCNNCSSETTCRS